MKSYHKREWPVPYILFALILLSWLGYTIFGLINQYSYWIDEIYSVAAAGKKILAKIELYLSDVYPPLYQFLLSSWVNKFGTSEAATKSLSAMCVLLALPAFLYAASYICRKIALLSIIFFLRNSFICYHSQEVRSYGLFLTLSLWSTILFLANERRIFLFVFSALSLIHFFGTVLACVILFYGYY